MIGETEAEMVLGHAMTFGPRGTRKVWPEVYELREQQRLRLLALRRA